MIKLEWYGHVQGIANEKLLKQIYSGHKIVRRKPRRSGVEGVRGKNEHQGRGM